jgi:hypothetical protein
LTSDQIGQLRDLTLELDKELQKESLMLTFVPNFWWYNIFAHENFYERFLSVLSQAPGAFKKIKNWDECIQTNLSENKY